MEGRRRKSGANPPGQRPEASDGQDFSVVVPRDESRRRVWRDLQRLAPMAFMAMLFSTLLLAVFFLLDARGLLANLLDFGGSLESLAIRSLLIYGLIPLLTASLLITVYRPAPLILLGRRPPLPALLSAPAAGFLLGWLLWCALAFLESFSWVSSDWLALPEAWRWGALHLFRSPLSAALILLVTLVLPATCHELLYRGLILPVFRAGGRAGSLLLPALLAAAASFDRPGFPVLFLGALMASWVRMKTDSLLASALSTGAFAGAMLVSGTLFGAISQLAAGMPLIDPYRIRVFLVTLALILIVLLLAPLALIGSAGRSWSQEETGLPKGRTAPFGKTNRMAALLCLLAVAAILYFFS
ncbi:MAG: lysostaphin resistance A-like protein [Saccharofermentanales bacterium]